MAAKAPVSPEHRKKVLKVLFISLLLDLVRPSKSGTRGLCLVG
jgi:hypothetical protein